MNEKDFCEGMLSYAQWTNFCLKRVSNLQLNSIQPGVPGEYFTFEDSSFATLWNPALLSASPIRARPPDPSCSQDGKQCVFLCVCVCVPSPTYTPSHPVSLCWCWGSLACCVSVPLGKPAMQMSLKHGDENRKLLWSKHLLCYFSAAVAAGAHMVPVPAANHLSDTDECIFHIRMD